MARTISFIIETLDGAPVFHIPFPISYSGALAGVGNENENVKFVFRNRGGTPTFHVGGAEVGVSSADAWDYATVVNAVMRERRVKSEKDRAVGSGVAGSPQVRVKVEEETPKIPGKGQDKGKQRQREGGSSAATGVQNTDRVIDISTPRRPPVPGSQPAVLRQYSREERDAFRRHSLTVETLEEVYETSRQQFAFAIDPSQPVTRPLTAEEGAEWHRLWDSLLHMDRVFAGPLRDAEALQRRSEDMIAAAAERVLSAGRTGPRNSRQAFHFAETSGHEEESLAVAPPSDLVPAGGSGAQSNPSRQRRTHANPLPVEGGADAVPAGHSEEFVESVRRALRPLHSAMLAKSQEVGSDTAGSSRAGFSNALASGKGGKATSKGQDKETEWPPRRVRSKGGAALKENGVVENASSANEAKQTATVAARTSDVDNRTARGVPAVGTKRPRAEEKLDAPAKRSKRGQVLEPPPTTRTTRSRSAQVGAARSAQAGNSKEMPRDAPNSRAGQVGAPADQPEIPHSRTLKIAYANTPRQSAYNAFIPPADSNPENPLLTPAESAWLAAQHDLARAPDYWRPVRWLDLGARMYDESLKRQRQGAAPVRPLYHGVLLAAWDRGEWRFPGHESVGRVGVPWSEWVQGEEGRRWRGRT
ncbi:hypothetical protein B0H14DRAFT_2719672 [Mycena olivaceomarginata]|nr:hypothetical protein B0H14DRAFT_2719672 [Mycena olivaceomarginata]